MGAIGGLLGTAGGASGTGFKKPGSADIQSGVSMNQIGESYGANQNALGSQQALLNALQSQNGLGAQSNSLASQQALLQALGGNNGASNVASAYGQTQGLANQQQGLNAVGMQGSALSQQQALNAQLANAGGVQNLSGALSAQQGLAAQQQALASQYQDVASGTGYNPAMAQLNQATGQNIANQAALMAGQRGAGANVGLIARQAAQQGAATQQQAVGQGATMQAQQSLGALSGLAAQQQAIGSTQQNVANIAAQQVGMQQAGTNAAQSAASNIASQQQAQQQMLASQAANQVTQQQGQQQIVGNQANAIANQQIAGTAANTQAQQSEQQILQNALAAKNNASVGMQSNVNAANAGLANPILQGQQGMIGGAMNSIGAAAALAGGGEIKKSRKKDSPEAPLQLAQGDYVQPNQTPAQTPGAPQSGWVNFVKGALAPSQPPPQPAAPQQNFNMAQSGNYGAQSLQKGFGSFGPALSNMMRSSTPAPSGNLYTGPDVNETPKQEALAAKGGLMKKRDFTSGGNVAAQSDNQKAEKDGNSYDNDKIPAMLSEGEVVLPRSVMQSEDPIKSAVEFVTNILAKRRA